MGLSRTNRLPVFVASLGVVAGCSGGSSGGSHAGPSASPSFSAPPASATVDRGKYRIEACPDTPPAHGASWFTSQSIKGKPGSGAWTATRLIDAGTIDLSDGQLWDNGAEYLAGDASPSGATKVPAGDPHVVILVATSADHHGAVAAVEVRVATARPVKWTQIDSLGGSTKAGAMGIAGHAGLERLRAVRPLDAAFSDLDATKTWITPCLRYSLASDAAAAPLTALIVHLPGSGGWPGAIGYDKAGNPADVVISIGLLPWSLLGLPGTPPAQAVAVEPTATASATTSTSP